MLRRFLALSALGVLAACASVDAGPPRRPEVPWDQMWPGLARPDVESFAGEGAFPARRPDPAGLERLKEAERLWRAGDDEAFAQARGELDQDPVLAFWLARMLVRDALFLRDAATADADTMVGPPPWERPFDALVAMGEAAAPCVVLDLLRQRSVDLRDFGARVLHAMGPAALPAWERTFDVADPLVRRYAVHAVTGWEADDGGRVFALLEHATRDPDFGVRAQAWRAIGEAGGDQGARLRAALAAEADGFVQRAIVDALGHQGDVESAEAVVGFLEGAAQVGDADGMEAAQRALMRMSGTNEPASPVSWRRWLAERRQE